jgi:hypothetical protein
MDYQEIIIGVLATMGTAVIIQLLRFLQGALNKNKHLGQTTLDDQFVSGLMRIVEGVTGPLAAMWKEANSDGKLTEDEKKRLKAKAKELIIQEGKEKGVDYLKECGPQLFETALEFVVNRFKKR